MDTLPLTKVQEQLFIALEQIYIVEKYVGEKDSRVVYI